MYGGMGEDARDFIKNIPLSFRSIVRRIEAISEFIYANIKNKILSCKYFSICLDEFTDINDIAQLLC